MPSGRERAIVRGHADIVRSLSFSPDGSRLVSSGQDRLVMVWDTVDGKPLLPIGGSGANTVLFAAYSPDGSVIAVGESSGAPENISIYDAETGLLRMVLKGHLEGINALTFARDGQTLASAGNDGQIKLWDINTASEVTTFSDDVGWVSPIAFSPDGSWLAFAGRDSTIRIRDLNTHVSFRIDSPPNLETRVGKAATPEKRALRQRGV